MGGEDEGREEFRDQVVGGFLFMTVGEVMGIWDAYQAGRVPLLGLRAYFALREMEHRRYRSDRRQAAATELQRLLGGVAVESLRRAVRALEREGLSRVGEDGFRVALARQRDSATASALARKPGSKIPVPRRTVKLIARSGRRVFIATLLAHLVRCVRYRGRVGRFQVVSGGTCAASWVVRTFGVSRSEVVRARSELTRLGWLRRLEGQDHWHRWKFGAWSVPSLSFGETEITPGLADIRPEITPTNNQNPLLRRAKNQNPASPRPATGAYEKQEEERAPTLRRVTPADLENTERLLTLHQEAVAKGWVGADSETAELETIALAERARRVGSNAPALFRYLLEHGMRGFITSTDEERARQRLRCYRYQPPPVEVRELLEDTGPALEPPRRYTRPELAALPPERRAENTLAWARWNAERAA